MALRILLLIALLGLIIPGMAQVGNDDCSAAILILDSKNYCSPENTVSNEMATPTTFPTPSCFNSINKDIWYTFIAMANDVSIVVNGASGQNAGGTMQGPKIALYAGTCQSQFATKCAYSGQNIVELKQNGLVIGDTYNVRVDSDVPGTFQFCIRNFQAPVEPGQDCQTAAILCDTSFFVVDRVVGAGQVIDEARNTCLGAIEQISSESQSTWFKWEAGNDGLLEFTLTPLNTNDDIDFVLFELPDGIDNCDNKMVVRCNGTACLGSTGLRAGSTDLEEDFDCNPGEDGFLAPLQMTTGKAYALLVNNFDNSGVGFSFEFGGTGLLAGPIPDFQLDPNVDISCNQPIVITNASSYDNGTIVNYNWSFGTDANIASSNAPGPHNIAYSSFGNKFIVLTVESDKGCLNTIVKPIEVDTCCSPSVDDLELNILEQMDARCFNSEDGSISVGAISGLATSFNYSFNGEAFNPISEFYNLSMGMYSIVVQDNLGCTDSVQVTINEPDLFSVDAGSDVESEMGELVEITAKITPDNLDYVITWMSSNGDSILCVDELCYRVMVTPPGPTEYIVTVFDENGCSAADTVLSVVEISQDIYYPNIFSPNQDGLNDYFNLRSGNWVSNIEVLRVFDRWGALVYEGFDLPINDSQSGWDGTENGSLLNPGVYTFYASVVFVDQKTKIVAGDITLVR